MVSGKNPHYFSLLQTSMEFETIKLLFTDSVYPSEGSKTPQLCFMSLLIGFLTTYSLTY